MDPTRGGWESAVAALAVEEGPTRLLDGRVRALVWSLDGERLLWASADAAELGRRWGAPNPGDAPIRARLRVLGRGGLAPRDGFRLEKWRQDRLAAPRTVACRVIADADGEQALLTVMVDDGPEPAPAPRPVLPAGPDRPAPAPSAPPAARRSPETRAAGRGRRFTWAMDREGRFTEVSAADGIGREAGRIRGRRWRDLVGPIVRDEAGAVAAALAAGTGWSRVRILCRGEEPGTGLPVEISGAPVSDASGDVAGFRGFAVAFPDQAEPLPPGTFAGEETEAAAMPPPHHVPAPPATALAVTEPLPIGVDVAYEGFGQAMTAAAALTGSARDSVFGVLRAFFSPQLAAVASPAPAQPPARELAARSAAAADGSLSAAESGALHEIARALAAPGHPVPAATGGRGPAEIVPLPPRPRIPEAARILEHLPVAAAVLRDEVPVFANRRFLDLVGHDDLPGWVAVGGATGLAGGGSGRTGEADAVTVASGVVAEMRRETIAWGDAPATLLTLAARAPAAERQMRDALEHELAAGRARAQELLSSLDLAADGILTLDLSGRILSASRTAETLFGYAANEIAGEVVTAVIAPEDHRDFLACLEAVSRLPPGTSRECEARGRVRAGQTRPFSVRAGIAAGGREPVYVLSFRDLTRVKAAEAELRQARSAAERAGRHRAEFLARVSHEIRTPLTAITGFAELMLEERFGPLGNSRYRDYVRDIHGSSGHVVSLVNDLLDLAKASSGESDLEPVDLDLNEVVSRCIALSGPLAGREKTIVRTSFDPALPPVRADERSVRQIVLNVLSNAIRFTGAGGQVIVSTASAAPNGVRLSVRDTGPGLSESEIEDALTPFRQVQSTRRGDGTGLGLPLSKALVEANGGVLTITSGRERGTLVAIHLPAAAPRAAAAE